MTQCSADWGSEDFVEDLTPCAKRITDTHEYAVAAFLLDGAAIRESLDGETVKE